MIEITPEQEQLIRDAWEYVVDHDKSTEWGLQYASDLSEVEYDEVVEFITLHYFEENEQD